MSPVPTSKGKEREPPPTLFLGPPSRNASHASIPGIITNLAPGSNTITSPSTTQRAPLLRQRSHRVTPRSNFEAPVDATPGSNLPRSGVPRQQQSSEVQKQADRTDALWAEMQSTLEEVDLSAASGMHVFGPDHSKALEELRTAQIALAQAWARSEADDVVETVDKDSKALRVGGMLGSEGKSALDGTDGAKSTANSGSGRPGSSGVEKTTSKLQVETESDILLARRRREANDHYFQRVNEGVLEVVAKLEGVAVAMKAVEQESRDIWGETDTSLSA